LGLVSVKNSSTFKQVGNMFQTLFSSDLVTDSQNSVKC